MNSTEACIALNMLPTMGPVRLRKLLEVLGVRKTCSRQNGISCARSRESATKLPIKSAAGNRVVDLAAELARIREFGAEVITQESPSYPDH